MKNRDLIVFFVLIVMISACAPQLPTETEAPKLNDLFIPLPTATSDLSSTWPDQVREWEDEINLAARNNSTPVNLLAAICLQQSNCDDPEKIGPNGEVGLLQIVASDSKIARGNPGYSVRPTTKELVVGEFNLDYGASLLAEYLDNYYNSNNVDETNLANISDQAIEYALRRYTGNNDFLVSEIMNLYISSK